MSAAKASSADTAMPSPNQPSEPLSSTAASAAGTLDSSAYHKERRSSISMKRHHHDDDIDYDKDTAATHSDKDKNDHHATLHDEDDDDSSALGNEARTSSTASSASPSPTAANDTGGDAVMTHSPTPKKMRMSVQLPEQIKAQKQREAAAAAAAAAAANGGVVSAEVHPVRPERTSSTSTASPPTTPHTPSNSAPMHARRGSMTEDQKRASFTQTLAKALHASYPLSPVPAPSPTATSPHIASIAATLEAELFARHAGLTLEYTAHVRDIAYNLTHSIPLARRIVNGRVSIERVAGMNWKEFADSETKHERDERKEEDLVAHLAPVDVTPGILPNAKTVER